MPSMYVLCVAVLIHTVLCWALMCTGVTNTVNVYEWSSDFHQQLWPNVPFYDMLQI